MEKHFTCLNYFNIYFTMSEAYNWKNTYPIKICLFVKYC